MSISDEPGRAEIEPREVEAGGSPLLRLTYTVGGSGIAMGGGIQIRFPWGCWTPVVMAEIPVHRYLQVINSDVELASGNPQASIEPRVWLRGVLESWVDIKVTGGPLAAGDKIVFTYGVRERKSPPVRCQNYAEKGAAFHVLVDTRGTGQMQRLAASPTVDVRAGPPAQLEIVAPSVVQAGETFRFRVRAQDRFRNDPCAALLGQVAFSSGDGRAALPLPRSLTAADRNRAVCEASFPIGGIKTILAKYDGPARLLSAASTQPLSLGLDSAEMQPIGSAVCDIGPVYGARVRTCHEADLAAFAARSNPIRVVDGAPPYRLYWGDIHGHSTLSDGRLPVDEMYAYARDVALLDIAASGDHETAFFADKWETAQAAANEFYRPGEFVTFRGFEWTSNNYGHRNVYYRTAAPTPPLPHVDYGHIHYRMPPSEFYSLIADSHALIVPHHTLVGTNWDYHDHRERLVEIYSTWGRTEFSGNSLWDKPDDPRGGVQNGLARGYRLGIIGGSDCHDSGPGRCYPGSGARNLNYRGGLMAVLAPALTREDIFDALWARRCYATTGEQILLDFTADDHVMGQEFQVSAPIRVQARVTGTDRITLLEIIKNSRVLCAHRGANDTETLDCVDAELPAPGEWSFYYVRVTQADGNMAWSSPIWIGHQ